jgi:hypothetical protein
MEVFESEGLFLEGEDSEDEDDVVAELLSDLLTGPEVVFRA